MSQTKKKYPNLKIDDLTTGYFMLYESTGDLFGRLIEKHQRKLGLPKDHAKYIHIDVLGPQQWAIRVNPPRAKVVDIFKHYKGKKACMVKYKTPNYETRRQYVAWWAVSHNNKRYDYLGVIKFKLAWLFHKKDLYFCSENAAWALRREYPRAFKDQKNHTIMPGHFLGPEFEVMWEGTIE